MTTKDKQTKKRKKKGDWPTGMDLKRYLAWAGMICFILAVIVSISATILMLIGTGCMLLAFEKHVRKGIKAVKKNGN